MDATDYELIDVFQSQQTLVDVERGRVSELLLFVMIETHTQRKGIHLRE